VRQCASADLRVCSPTEHGAERDVAGLVFMPALHREPQDIAIVREGRINIPDRQLRDQASESHHALPFMV
jgi:hypothetical protein